MIAEMIYLDYAATTPTDPRVVKAMQPFWTKRFFNAAAHYRAARENKEIMEAARRTIAKILGAKPDEIVFTSGGTESDNLAIHGLMQQYHDGNVVVSAIEHQAVHAPAKEYQRRIAEVDRQGIVILGKLRQLIDDQTVLISVMQVNNEIGTIQPIRDIARMVSQIRQERSAAGLTRSLYLHSDSCQAPNYLPVSVSGLGVDLMTLNSGKVYGPKQVGCLYIKRGVTLLPQVLGGGQEKGMRSGTESIGLIHGFATALALSAELREGEAKRLSGLRDKMAKALLALPGLSINGSMKRRVANNLNIHYPGMDGARAVVMLDQAGLMVATGSACNAFKEGASHVIRALGQSERQAQASLRITLGRFTTATDIDRATKILLEVLPRTVQPLARR